MGAVPAKDTGSDEEVKPRARRAAAAKPAVTYIELGDSDEEEDEENSEDDSDFEADEESD
jgi:hypothetical protein